MPDTSSSSIPRLTLTVNEAAASLGVSSRLLWGRIYDGKIAVTRVGARVLIRVADLEALLEDGRDLTGEPRFRRPKRITAGDIPSMGL
jgi:excisionase family DNA binding protein